MSELFRKWVAEYVLKAEFGYIKEVVKSKIPMSLASRWWAKALGALGFGAVGYGAYSIWHRSEQGKEGKMIPGNQNLCERDYEAVFHAYSQRLQKALGPEVIADLTAYISMVINFPHGAKKVSCDEFWQDGPVFDVLAIKAWQAICGEGPRSLAEYKELLYRMVADHHQSTDVKSPTQTDSKQPIEKGNKMIEQSNLDDWEKEFSKNSLDDTVKLKPVSIAVKPTTKPGTQTKLTTKELMKIAGEVAISENKKFDDTKAYQAIQDADSAVNPEDYYPEMNNAIVRKLLDRGITGLHAQKLATAIMKMKDLRGESGNPKPAKGKEEISSSGVRYLTNFIGGRMLALIDAAYSTDGNELPYAVRAPLIAALIEDNKLGGKVDIQNVSRLFLRPGTIGKRFILRNIKGTKFSQDNYNKFKNSITEKKQADFDMYWKQYVKEKFDKATSSFGKNIAPYYKSVGIKADGTQTDTGEVIDKSKLDDVLEGRGGEFSGAGSTASIDNESGEGGIA